MGYTFPVASLRRASKMTAAQYRQLRNSGFETWRIMEKTPHILIVDDDREIRDLLSRFLQKHGFRASTAADGRDMRKILADARIDLIVLDVMMPGETGLQICAQLRAQGIPGPSGPGAGAGAART